MTTTLGVAVLGAGRIGQIHIRTIADHDNAKLIAVAEADHSLATRIRKRYGCAIRSPGQIAGDSSIDAVVICTPTASHATLTAFFARKGKAVFCEKPLDLDAQRAHACLKVVQQCQMPLMIGFNRRFDPHFTAAKKAIADGRIGRPEMAVIISRDPAPPTPDYIRSSGGLFKDMMIHDFDMASFLFDALPLSVQATGSVLADSQSGALGDYDSASCILSMAGGAQVMISNSRRASYGYDQRIEVHGSAGMVQAENQRQAAIVVATADGFNQPPLHDFFMTRYAEAYRNEMDSFIRNLNTNIPPTPGGEDGLNALLVAEAALKSAQTGQTIPVSYPGT